MPWSRLSNKFTPKLERNLCKAKNVCFLRIFHFYLVVLRGVNITLYWKGHVSNICIWKGRLDAAPKVDFHSNPGILIVACSHRMLDSSDTDSQNCNHNIIGGNER